MNLTSFVDGIRQKTNKDKGWRSFQQDLEDPSIYWEMAKSNRPQDWSIPDTKGTPYSKAEIDALSASGWECIVVEWERNWRNPAEPDVRLHW